LIDPGIVLAIVMLAVWVVGTALSWGGWVHALFTAGVFLLLHRIISKGHGQRAKGNG